MVTIKKTPWRRALRTSLIGAALAGSLWAGHCPQASAQDQPVDAAEKARQTAARYQRLNENNEEGSGFGLTGALILGSIASFALWHFFWKDNR